MRARIKARIKSFFTVARFKRFASAYILSYLGTFLSLSFLAIMFWSSVSSPTAIYGLIKHSGVEENLVYQLAEKTNTKEINSNLITEEELNTSIDIVFNERIKNSINTEFSKVFHNWVAHDYGPFYFSYDLALQEDELKAINSNINTKFLDSGKLVIEYDSGESSIKLIPQRAYTYFWWATILGPIFFVLLAIALVIFYRSKIEDLLYRIKRMLYYSSIAVLFSVPLNNIYWNFLANRMSTYPKAGLAGALSVKPITSEILWRMNMIAALSFVVYLTGFLLIKKFLKIRKFEKVEEKHKNDVWEFVVKITKYYLRKLK
jgi:hypothetical protein